MVSQLYPDTTAHALRDAWLIESLAAAMFDAEARASNNLLGYEDQGEAAREHWRVKARQVREFMAADGWTFNAPSQNKSGFQRVVRALAANMKVSAP